MWNGDRGIDATQGEGVVVGIIDTGVNFRHPAFAEVRPVDGHAHENPRGTFFGLCDPLTGTLGSIDQAVRDQVDVINFSIGGGPANPWTSALALAGTGAVREEIPGPA